MPLSRGYPYMKSILVILPLSMLLLVSCDDESSSGEDDCISASSVMSSTVIDDRYIISLPKEEGATGGRKSAKAMRLLERHRLSGERILNSFTGKNTHVVLNLSEREADELAKDPEILRIEQDKVTWACGCFSVVEPRLVTWSAAKVGYGDGTGKTAWILDTGVDYDHPDLTVDTKRSRSFLDEFVNAEDGSGHGTHIAGIIGGNNNKLGILGIASGATIVALKVLNDEGNGTVSSLLDGLAYVEQYGEPGDVINISLTAPGSEILDDEVRSLGEKGFYVAIAAGNEQTTASSYSPGRVNGPNIYTVSAVDSLNQMITNSNYGNDVIDFAAPGQRIISTYKDKQYAKMTGT
jgi:subtilisin